MTSLPEASEPESDRPPSKEYALDVARPPHLVVSHPTKRDDNAPVASTGNNLTSSLLVQDTSDTSVMVAKLRDIIATSDGLLTEPDTYLNDDMSEGVAPSKNVASSAIESGMGIESGSSPGADKSLSDQKNTLISYIQDQIQNLSIRSNILRFKYDGYKRWFDIFSISILLLSASLTFIEAIRAHIRVDEECDEGDTPGHVIAMSLVPIAIGSTLTILSALIKFNKYHIKMEKIEKAIQKAIFTTFRLKRTQENVKHLQSIAGLNDALRVYSAEPYDMYITSLEEMERNLKYEDMVTHMQTYYDLSIECKRGEMNYRIKRLMLGATESLRESEVAENAMVSMQYERKRRRGLQTIATRCCARVQQIICGNTSVAHI